MPEAGMPGANRGRHCQPVDQEGRVMVLLSFSVKEDELKAGTKIRTTRLYTPEKYRQWQITMTKPRYLLDIWWKPRTPSGYFIDSRHGADLYRLQFHELNGRPWPYRERDSGLFTPMTTEEFKQYLREEGFEGQLEEFLQFFEKHYAPLDGVVFQSIAFPPLKGVD